MAERSRSPSLKSEASRPDCAEAEQFQRQIELYYQPLFSVAKRLDYRKTGCEAADLVQETMYKACRDRATAPLNPAQMRAWLHTIMIRSYYNRLRDEKRLRLHILGETALYALYQDPKALDIIEDIELRQVIDKAMQSLPPEVRIVLEARHDGTKVKDMEMRGVSSSTYQRCLRLLRRALKGLKVPA